MAGQPYPSPGAIPAFILWYSRRMESAAVAVLQIAFVLVIFAVLHVAMFLNGLLSVKDYRPPARKTHDVTRDLP